MKRDSHVSADVRSALMHLTLCEMDGDRKVGSKTSVRVRSDTWGSSRRAEARALPMKPPAPVTRIFILRRRSPLASQCNHGTVSLL